MRDYDDELLWLSSPVVCNMKLASNKESQTTLEAKIELWSVKDLLMSRFPLY